MHPWGTRKLLDIPMNGCCWLVNIVCYCKWETNLHYLITQPELRRILTNQQCGLEGVSVTSWYPTGALISDNQGWFALWEDHFYISSPHVLRPPKTGALVEVVRYNMHHFPPICLWFAEYAKFAGHVQRILEMSSEELWLNSIKCPAKSLKCPARLKTISRTLGLPKNKQQQQQQQNDSYRTTVLWKTFWVHILCVQ